MNPNKGLSREQDIRLHQRWWQDLLERSGWKAQLEREALYKAHERGRRAAPPQLSFSWPQKRVR